MESLESLAYMNISTLNSFSGTFNFHILPLNFSIYIQVKKAKSNEELLVWETPSSKNVRRLSQNMYLIPSKNLKWL